MGRQEKQNLLATRASSRQSKHIPKETAMSTQDALRMTPNELHLRLDRGEPVIILDVRTEDAR
jgi:hypothetical protein